MPTRGFQNGGERVSHYDPTLQTTFANGSLWQSCPLLEQLHDPSLLFLYEESFANYDATATTGDWVATAATSGTAAISTTVPGALKLDPGATTAHQGIQIQRTKCAFLPATGKHIWFEVAVIAGTGLTLETFLGLAAIDTTIIASGSMSTNNRIGWTGVAGDGVVQFDCDKAGTGSLTTGTTLSTSATKRLGFYYDGTADTIQQYINGVKVGSAIATTYVSKSVMYPSFVCQTSGTTQSTLTISGLRIAQLR